MNPFYVKEEWGGSGCLYWGEPSPSSSRATQPPQPMEGLNGTGPPPFLNKTYDLVDDSSTNFIISWGKGNNTFVVWDPQLFSLNLLPRYFKHSNFSSFVRQLNTYGFRKVDPDKWEFANEGFLRGKRNLLKNIKRKKTTSSQSQFEDQDSDPCIELGRFGADAEIDMLRRDKQVLLDELVKLRQEQQSSRTHLKEMEERIKGTERKQQQMMSFLVRALQNPSFVQQLILQQDRKKLEGPISNKRRRPIEQCNLGNNNFGELSKLGDGNDFVSSGFKNYGEVADVEDSELDRLAIEMQGGVSKKSDEGYLWKDEKRDGGDGGLDQRFWEDLMNDGNEQKLGTLGFEQQEEEEFRLSGFWSEIHLGLLSNDHLPARKELLVLHVEKEVADDDKAFGVAFDAFLIEGNW